MEQLYLETPGGRLPVAPEDAKRLGLHSGDISPFTRCRVLGGPVGQSGASPDEKPPLAADPKNTGGKLHIDDDKDGIPFTTSEILDIAQGADSYEH